MTVPVVAAAAVLSACAEAPTRSVLTAYVSAADQWIDRCATLRRTSEGTSQRREAACVRQAHESVEPLYSAASAAVRGQRGTTMYLERYRDEWNAAMTALRNSGPTDGQENTIEEQRKALHDIASKLTNG